MERIAALGVSSICGGIVGLLSGLLALIIPAVMSAATGLNYRVMPNRPQAGATTAGYGFGVVVRLNSSVGLPFWQMGIVLAVVAIFYSIFAGSAYLSTQAH
ncbi:hypothetical protein [Trueperella pyogenes]